jgi:hypothetical protein
MMACRGHADNFNPEERTSSAHWIRGCTGPRDSYTYRRREKSYLARTQTPVFKQWTVIILIELSQLKE